MLKKSVFSENKVLTSKNIITGGIIGGILGTVAALWNRYGILNIPILRTYLSESTLDEMIMGPILGIVIGGAIGYLMALHVPQDEAIEAKAVKDEAMKYDSEIKDVTESEQITDDSDSKQKLQLREEQLDIYKKWIKTGEVSVHKEVFTEEKNITVPVTREELVIEKKVLDSEALVERDESMDTIRIPISEERIDIIKHKVILEDVKIYKNQFQDIKHIEEILKKEKLRVKTNGNPKIIDKDSEDNS